MIQPTFSRVRVLTFVLVSALWAVSSAAAEHTFLLNTAGWHEQPTSVYVAGTFNGWNQHAVEKPPND